jgi:hypothetical protein
VLGRLLGIRLLRATVHNRETLWSCLGTMPVPDPVREQQRPVKAGREYYASSCWPAWCSAFAHARPWLWASSSTGRALSPAGEETGVELRFSYYQ